MSKLTTEKEIKTALSIGCKLHHSTWASHAYIYCKGSDVYVESGNRIGTTDNVELRVSNIGHWEIYHENQGSNTSS